MITTYKYRLKDRGAKKALRAYAYACNQVWNWCVAHHKDFESRHRAGAVRRNWPSFFDLAKYCNGVGTEIGLPQRTVRAVCEQFAASRDQHKRCPKFRSSFGTRRSLGWVPFQKQGRTVTFDSVVYHGRALRFFGGKKRPLPKTAKGGMFVEDTRGRWFVCFHVETEGHAPRHEPEVGIDLGLKVFAALSSGEVINAPQYYRKFAPKLSVAQRAGNRKRALAIYSRITNSRSDFHHKLSTRLAREYAFIAVGNVSAKNLAKTKFSKSVFDAGWSTFRKMLAYKATTFVEVDERFTTQTCSSCGSVPLGRPKGAAGLGIRFWKCTDCGASHDRDVNAALNILRIGRGVAPPVEESRRAA